MIKYVRLGKFDITPPTIIITSVDETVLAEIQRWGHAEPILLTQVTITFSSGNTYIGQLTEAGLRDAYIDDRITLDELEAALTHVPR